MREIDDNGQTDMLLKGRYTEVPVGLIIVFENMVLGLLILCPDIQGASKKLGLVIFALYP